MKHPQFSVIIPTLNEEKFLPQLLESLTQQSVKDFEVIVVDGNSTDKTIAVAKAYSKTLPSLQIMTSLKASPPLQRNLGAHNAHGAWLVFVDADSILAPYFFQRVLLYITSNQPSLFTTWFQPDSETSGEVMVTLVANMLLEGFVLFGRPLAPGPLTGVRKDVFERVGGYDEKHSYSEDVDLGLRLHAKGVQLKILRETLYTLSLRRLRKEGKLKVLQQYVLSALPVFLLNKTIRHMPGYVMGGQLYEKGKKPLKQSVLKRYEAKLKKLLEEFFVML